MKGEVEASLLGIFSKMLYVIKVIRIRNIFSNLHKRKETACMGTQLLYLLGVTKYYSSFEKLENMYQDLNSVQ